MLEIATGIKKIQREKGYGAWFDQLFPLIKTRDSCKPENAPEPSASKEDDEEADKNDTDNVAVMPNKVYVPIRSKIKSKRRPCQKLLVW